MLKKSKIVIQYIISVHLKYIINQCPGGGVRVSTGFYPPYSHHCHKLRRYRFFESRETRPQRAMLLVALLFIFRFIFIFSMKKAVHSIWRRNLVRQRGEAYFCVLPEIQFNITRTSCQIPRERDRSDVFIFYIYPPPHPRRSALASRRRDVSRYFRRPAPPIADEKSWSRSERNSTFFRPTDRNGEEKRKKKGNITKFRAAGGGLHYGPFDNN